MIASHAQTSKAAAILDHVITLKFDLGRRRVISETVLSGMSCPPCYAIVVAICQITSRALSGLIGNLIVPGFDDVEIAVVLPSVACCTALCCLLYAPQTMLMNFSGCCDVAN